MIYTYYVVKCKCYYYKRRLFIDGIKIISEKNCIHKNLEMIEIKTIQEVSWI